MNLRGYKPTTEGHAGMIRRAAELIDQAKRPIIISGHGVIWSNAHRELVELAEKAQIPVISTFLGIGGFPESHVLSYGFLGMHGMFYANMAADKADLVIGVGMRFDDRAMGRFKDFNPGVKIIHIDIDPAEIGKNFPDHCADRGRCEERASAHCGAGEAAIPPRLDPLDRPAEG